jgi:flagellar motility protein MotE (MotC chaperone)
VLPDPPAPPATLDETADTIPGTVAAGATPRIASEPKGATAAARNQAFVRLQRAYESMEPESAAKALVALAARDKEVVIDLLMGWKPRTSGAILDAVTQNNAGLAADLSYEIWRRSGNPAEPAARSGR